MQILSELLFFFTVAGSSFVPTEAAGNDDRNSVETAIGSNTRIINLKTLNESLDEKLVDLAENLSIKNIKYEEDEEMWGRLLQASVITVEQDKCTLTTDIWCQTNDGTKCNELVATPGTCEEIELNYKFRTCNTSEFKAEVTSSTAAINGMPLPQIDFTGELEGGNCYFRKSTISVNTCNSKIKVTLDINAKTLSSGFLCSSSAGNNAVNTFIEPPECEVEIDVVCETVDGNECVVPLGSTMCTFRPFYFDFEFTGGSCESSINSQEEGKFDCIDYQNMVDVIDAFIIVKATKKSVEYFSGTVSKGTTFRIGIGSKVEADMTVTIYSHNGGQILQDFTFHSSCSQNLFLGDSFGAIVIAGFNDDVNRVTSSKTDLNFSYSIRNKASNEIRVNFVKFTIDNETNILNIWRKVASGGTYNGISTLEIEPSSSDIEVGAEVSARSIPLEYKQDCNANSFSTVKAYPPMSGKGGKGGKGSKGGKGGKSSIKSNGGEGKGKSAKGSNKVYEGTEKGKGKKEKGLTSVSKKSKTKKRLRRI